MVHIYLTLMKRNSMKSKHTKVIEALEGLVQDLHLMENRMKHYSIAKEDYLILDDMKKSIENKKKEIDQFIREYGVSTKTYKSIQGMMKYQIYAPVVRPRLKKRRKTMWDEYLMGIGYLSNREWY